MLMLLLAMSLNTVAEAQESPTAETAGGINQEVHDQLEKVRVLKEDAGLVVTKAMNFVVASGGLSWWSADVFGREGYVRVVACAGKEETPECFEVRLSDPAGGCDDGLAGSWCLEFPDEDPDEWVKGKLVIHPQIQANTVSSVWLEGGQNSPYIRELIQGAFKGTSEAFSVAAKPGIVEQGDEGEAADVPLTHFRGGDTPPEKLLLLEAALALFLFGFLLRRWDSSGWKQLFAWTGLVLVGLGLRWTMGFMGVFHENHHGYRYIVAILSGQGQTFGVPSSYMVTMHPLALLFGGTDQAIFLVNGIFSALCIPLLGILVRELTGNRAAGWIAGIIWAVSPHPVRLATSEVYFNASAFFLLAASLTALKAFRSLDKESDSRKDGVAMLVLAGLLITLSAQVRILTLLYPLAVALVVFAGGGLRSKRQWQWFAGLALGIGALCVPQGLGILEAIESQPSRSSGLVGAACLVTNGQNYIFFDPAIVSPFLLPLVFIGAFAVRKEGNSALHAGWAWIAAVFWVVACAGFVCGVEVSRIRFEVPAHAMLAGLAAVGITQLGSWLGRFHQHMGKIVWAACVALLLAPPLVFFSRDFQDTMEYAFLQESVVPMIFAEKEEALLIQAPLIAPEFGSIPEDWWRIQLGGLDANTPGAGGMDIYEKVENIPRIEGADPPKLLTYIGLDCFWAMPGFEDVPYPEASHVGGRRIHPGCAAALAGATWKPIVELDVTRTETVGSCVDIQAQAVSVGLYEGRLP